MTHTKYILAIVLLLGIPMLWLLSPNQSFGQAVYGSIFGTVTDSSGAVIPGAKITVTDEGKGTSATYIANRSGDYSAQDLIPDAYDVKVEAPGFAPTENTHVIVAADTGRRVDFTMRVGTQRQSVNVTEEAPQLETDRSDVAVVLDKNALEDLPVINRNFSLLLLLVPGSTLSPAGKTTENPQGGQHIYVNGQSWDGISYQLDGTDNRDPVLGIIVINPNLEAVSETKFTTQNYDAEFGNAMAGIITAQTRSGSNHFHGSVFEYRRSGAQQARDPFLQYAPDRSTGRFIPPTLWDQFGGAIGGPIRKDKFFFFGDDQSTRQKAGTTVQASVPTQLVRTTCLGASGNCDLSEYLGGGQNQVYDPTSGGPNGVGRTAFAGNLIPVSSLSPQAVALLRTLPGPTAPGIANNYITSGTGGYNLDQFDVRLDAQLKPNLHAFARYTFFNTHIDGAPAFGTAGGPGFGIQGYAGHDFSRDHSVAAGFDYAISSSLLTDFRFGWYQYYVHNLKYDQSVAAAQQFGLPGLNTGSYDTGGLPNVNVTGLTSFGDDVTSCNCPLDQMEHQFQIVNNWTKTIGNHSIRFGGDLRLAQNLRSASDSNRTGVLNFKQQNTAVNSTSSGGLGLATFLLGDVTTFSRFVVANQKAGEHQKRIFFFGQDTWRVTRKLTLNYGLRWEDIFPETITIPGEGGFVNLNDGFVHVGGVGGVPTNGGQQNNLTYFAPRLGLAYSPIARIALRIGYGRSFDEANFGAIFGTNMTHNIPVVANQSLQGPSAYDAAFALNAGPASYAFQAIPANGLVPMVNNLSYPSARPLQMEMPTIDMWDVSLQGQLTATTTLQMAYVGNWGSHNYPGTSPGFNINQPVIGPGPQVQRRPLYNHYVNGSNVCCNTDLTSMKTLATNNYNAMQTSLEKRLSHGLELHAYYTWSRALGYSNDYFVNNRRLTYGLFDYNRKSDLTMNLLYALPFGRGAQFAGNVPTGVNEMIGGWQVNSDTTWASGLPFTPGYSECTSDEDIDGVGGALCRPNKAGGFPYQSGSFNPTKHSLQFFTVAAPMTANGATSGSFQRPQQYQVGNIGRNSAIGPRLFTSDLSIFKSFAIADKATAQFRFDAFNVFNHPVLAQPNVCVDCTTGTPGQITGLGLGIAMRQLLFGVHVSF